MVFLVSMLGFLGFIGGIGLFVYGSSQGSDTLRILGGIVGVLGMVLLAYGGYLNQNKVIDRLRGDR